MVKCPHGHRSDQQVKVGFNPSGSQRYRCNGCRRKYTPEPAAHGYSEAIRRQALQLYIDGMNYRRIARHLGVSHQTVANWVKAYADRLPDTPPAPSAPLDVNEMDELFTYVGTKKRSLRHHPGGP
jgi:transposase